MASENVRRQFVARGIVPIEPGLGVRAMLDELTAASRHEPVVVFGDGPWTSEESRAAEVEVTA
jgi:hypothetical protein